MELFKSKNIYYGWLLSASYTTISTPGKTNDATVAAVVLPCVEGRIDSVESHNNDVDDVNGCVPQKFEAVTWSEMIVFPSSPITVWNDKTCRIFYDAKHYVWKCLTTVTNIIWCKKATEFSHVSNMNEIKSEKYILVNLKITYRQLN